MKKDRGFIVKKRTYDYKCGHRRAMRACIAWLYRRSDQMSDPHAKQILNSAAFSLGVEVKKIKKGISA